MKELILYEVVFEAHEAGNNKNKIYRANPNPHEAILKVLRTREKPMLSRIQAEFESLKDAMADHKIKVIEKDQVQKLGGMIKGAGIALTGLLTFSKIDPSAIFGKSKGD